jgi:hypothetical protein
MFKVSPTSPFAVSVPRKVRRTASLVQLNGENIAAYARLFGSLDDQAMRTALKNPRRELIYCEFAVQYQEHLLAITEYRMWCAAHGLQFSV